MPTPSDGPSIFFIGRHETRKGLAVLLEAMKQLPADVTPWVAGTGPLTEELRAANSGDERIEWLGRISDAERDARLAGARRVLCACPRRRELRAWCFSRGWRRHPGGRLQHPRLQQQRGHPRPQRPCSPSPRIPRRWPRRSPLC
ncbi:MAG: glycosyltransferase [Candidatus Microthrix sp.]|nr:glycosyltransferase [Candidatus Microthrix sp.]MBK6439576.1 glycosyltransferase [Candidatus Microthrix sp.]